MQDRESEIATTTSVVYIPWIREVNSENYSYRSPMSMKSNYETQADKELRDIIIKSCYYFLLFHLPEPWLARYKFNFRVLSFKTS